MLETILKNLNERKYETARRMCVDLLEKGGYSKAKLQGPMVEAYRCLGEVDKILDLLNDVKPKTQAEEWLLHVDYAKTYNQLGSHSFYSSSNVGAQGYSVDEYIQEKKSKALEHAQKAMLLARTSEQKEESAHIAGLCGDKEGLNILAAPKRRVSDLEDTVHDAVEYGKVMGTIITEGGVPVSGAKVTLGHHVQVKMPHPHEFPAPKYSMHCYPTIGDQVIQETTTDSQGAFAFTKVPEGRHDYLAVSQDPSKHAISTQFLVQGFQVEKDEPLEFNLKLNPWQSASALPAEPIPSQLNHQSCSYSLLKTDELNNPFYYDFPRQAMEIELPAGCPADPDKLLLISSEDINTPIPFQLAGGSIHYFTSLGERERKTIGLFCIKEGRFQAIAPAYGITLQKEGTTAIINTGKAAFRIPWGQAVSDIHPPLIQVKAVDNKWRGHGVMTLPQEVSILQCTTQTIEEGPLVTIIKVSYELSNNQSYSITWTAHMDEPYLLAHEESPGLEGAAFIFSLKEFMGGRCFVHWTPEHGDQHWLDTKPEDKEITGLFESVMFWRINQAFGAAFTGPSLSDKDYISVFSIRRGEWRDLDFENICEGPGDNNRELDWPYPEMIGSTISRISALTSSHGDVFFRWNMFRGERYWGIQVSSIDNNDGPFKEIRQVQHKVSSPRLQHFKNWRLDEADTIERPYVLIPRDKLIQARAKKDQPEFREIWNRVKSATNQGQTSADGVLFGLNGDPRLAWSRKHWLLNVARFYARTVLMGRDAGDFYNPVGGRNITPWVEIYDMIAASGVFTPEEEREVRAYFLLMGHMFMEGDFMNWKYNGRNTNFEADRADIVGAVGLVFYGNPDAVKMVEHVVSTMERNFNTYCTPGSGKWYENPACYYLHSYKCRMNLCWHLYQHNITQPSDIARLKDFLTWGPLLLTPPIPVKFEEMRDGLKEVDYNNTVKTRRIPPVGDHAHIGTFMNEHAALASRFYRDKDPEFADMVLWSYQAGNGGYGDRGGYPLLLAGLEAGDLKTVPAPTLVSRRLEGFGAIFRKNFEKENESYLLFKMGPGGYRYHNTEGSIIMFANGKPLIYDGGEAGETWRHTTLSFYDRHKPLAPGHIERFQTFPHLDFAQGVNPKALDMEEPTFLSDRCNHTDVDIAWERFREPNPQISRSVMAVQDDYVILHDEVRLPEDIPSYWHLQAVSDSNTGSAAEGFIFKGRFGTDLQVLLPDQEFLEEEIKQLPILEYSAKPDECFSTRHLQLKGKSPDHYTAVLRPLAPGQKPISSSELKVDGATVGLVVKGDGIDDLIFLQRCSTIYQDDKAAFFGKYASIQIRPSFQIITLLEGESLSFGNIKLESDGPSVSLKIEGDSINVWAKGKGKIKTSGLSRPLELELTEIKSSIHLTI